MEGVGNTYYSKRWIDPRKLSCFQTAQHVDGKSGCSEGCNDPTLWAVSSQAPAKRLSWILCLQPPGETLQTDQEPAQGELFCHFDDSKFDPKAALEWVLSVQQQTIWPPCNHRKAVQLTYYPRKQQVDTKKCVDTESAIQVCVCVCARLWAREKARERGRERNKVGECSHHDSSLCLAKFKIRWL